MKSEEQFERQQKRLGELTQIRSSWVGHWREISDFLLPRSGRFFTQDRNDGGKKHNNIYDSTGTRALRTLAAGLMSGATSPARPWFRLATSDPDLMGYLPVKTWLHQNTRTMLDIFQRSNTYRTFHALYGELGAFGTASSFIMDDFEKVIHHYPMTIGEYFIATDYKGRVNTLYHEFEKFTGEVVDEFGKKNCSLRVQGDYDNGNYFRPVSIVHAVEPRRDRDVTRKDAVNMPFMSCYFEKGSGEKKYLRESGMKFFRALCPRWEVMGGDSYGSSPAMDALGDIKQLQHEQLRKAEGIDFMVRPPVQMPSNAKNRDFLPGGVTYVDTSGPQNAARPVWDVNLRLDYLLGDIQDVRQRLSKAFHEDLFMMLANNTKSNMTATEVAERHEEKLVMLGPVLDRLHNELLEPKIEITFERMLAAGIVPPPPPELQGQDLNVEFVSMLAQAQRAISTNGIDRFVGNLGQVAAFKPEVLDKFDADKWVDVYSDQMGVDPELVVADDKVVLIRDHRAKVQQAAQQAALLEQGASAANKLGNTPTQGKNALTDAIGMFSGYTG
jgi:hypothetical protein